MTDDDGVAAETAPTTPLEDLEPEEPTLDQSDVETTDADDETSVPATDEVAPTPNFVVLLIGLVSFELPSPTPIVQLIEEQPPYRRFEIPVGLPEAQALAQAIHQINGARPGTHELFAAVLRETRTEIVAVRITHYDQGVFKGELDLMTPSGRVVLDCRVTDGLILSMRQGVTAPILVDETVLAQVAR